MSDERRTTNDGCRITNAESGTAKSHSSPRRASFAHHSSFVSRHSSFRSRQSGQAVVEYAIVFPLQLLITLAIIQLAHIFVAKQVLGYAAFCGARTKLVGLSDEEATRAACIPVSAVAGDTGVTRFDELEIPGWGPLRNYDAAQEKTTASYEIAPHQSGGQYVKCELDHLYQLDVPIVGSLVYTLGDVALGIEDFEDFGGAPHMRIKADCMLAQPWGDD